VHTGVRTLVVSDLHLGAASGVDVLRRSGPRAALIDALGDVERLVLLGDVLELRHGPRRAALAAAQPFFQELGRAFAGREIVVVAGNHDHALVESWLRRRGEAPVPEQLGLEQLFPAEEASPMLDTLAGWAAPARLTAAYPGLWLRDDVYATHGHYLDCHLTVPTLERLGIGITGRVLHRPAESFASVEDYEAVTGPVFAWIDAVARQAPTGATLNGQSTVRMWRALGGDRGASGKRGADGGASSKRGVDRGASGKRGGDRGASGKRGADGGASGKRGVDRGASGKRGADGGDAGGRAGIAGLADMASALRRRAIVEAFPLAIAALNHAGLGSFNADITGPELRRAGLRAMGEVAARLGLGDAHVIFGHTHRRGPLPGDAQAEWRGPSGARLINSGCWTYDAYFLTGTPGESPYWPGGSVIVEDDGPPILRRLLDEHTRSELMAA
jgi:hypothetical protein